MKKIFVCFALLLGAFSAEARVEKVSIQGGQGMLSAIIQTPDGTKGKRAPMVILMHGFGGNKDNGINNLMAQRLEQQGIASIRFDFIGHGESEGRFQDMTVPREVEDARCVLKYVQALPYVNRVAVLGHSQGGVVASLLAGEAGKSQISAVCLFAPAAVLRDDAIRGICFGKQYDTRNLPEYVEIFPNMRLGRDYVLEARELKIYETACRYSGPVCLIHGKADTVVPYTYSERYAHDYRHAELHLLPDADHGLNPSLEESVSIAVDFLSRRLKK